MIYVGLLARRRGGFRLTDGGGVATMIAAAADRSWEVRYERS